MSKKDLSTKFWLKGSQTESSPPVPTISAPTDANLTNNNPDLLKQTKLTPKTSNKPKPAPKNAAVKPGGTKKLFHSSDDLVDEGSPSSKFKHLFKADPNATTPIDKQAAIVESVVPVTSAKLETKPSKTLKLPTRDGKQVGNLVTYKDGTHEHKLRPAKLLEKNLGSGIPGVAILSGFLKPKSQAEDERKDSSISIFTNKPELKLLCELRDKKFHDPPAFVVPKVRIKLKSDHSDDESDEDSEPEIDAAIGKPQLELIDRLATVIEKTGLTKTNLNELDIKLSSTYGTAQGICGKGSYGVVKIVGKIDTKSKPEKCFAVKELKKKADEDLSHFTKRLISEFIILLSLNHKNIIKTYDLMRNSKGVYSEVLEYCVAGDLYSLVHETGGEGLTYIEADCFFKQILTGVIYMHSKGIAHCDLKPENVLVTKNGTCKIIDFGTAAVFKTSWEDDIQLSSGACGSEPYVAPEEYLARDYDPRLTDVWSLGVIYMVMRVANYLWFKAKKSDELYLQYLQKRPKYNDHGQITKKGKFEPIETLKDGTNSEVIHSKMETLYEILNPDPEERFTTLYIYESLWVSSTYVCV